MDETWNQCTLQITNYYESLYKQYAHHFRACDYGSAVSQTLKFQILADVMPLQGKRILDVGCGFADFADFLQNHYEKVEYEGVDLTPSIIEEARRLHPELPLQRLDILQEDPGKRYHVVTANGIFYRIQDNPFSYTQKLIQRMFELCTEAVAFTSLSAWSEKKEENEFYADPLELAAFCRELTPWIVLRHDYLPHDFTLYLYRERPL